MPASLSARTSRGITAELFGIAEASRRLSLGVCLAHSPRAQLVNAHREMEVQFVVGIAQHTCAGEWKAKEPADAPRKLR
jgi:hypothetical protein